MHFEAANAAELGTLIQFRTAR